MFKNFLKCGLVGWIAEILFTSIGSIHNRDWRLSGTTSLWMFPIYGLAAFLPWLYKYTKHLHAILRGILYTFCIFTVEFFSGLLLNLFHACPWDYSNALLNYKGIIRFDYAPLWFLLGLFYEKILTGNNIRRRFRNKKDCKTNSVAER